MNPALLHQPRVSRRPAVPDALPLPMSRTEMAARGWEGVDIVFVSGDAYVDHPSFAMAILARVLESAGLRVGMLCQPDWRKVDDWRRFGRPRLFFGISAGNMDSMINHYTANRKVRNDDAYSPGGRIGLRPDRATLSYCQRAREAYPGVPVIAGGVEASLRRLAHYDYWSDKVRRSILLDAKADLVAFGMGEESILEIARRLDAGQTVGDLRDMRGIAYVMGARESEEKFGQWFPAATPAESNPTDLASVARGLLHYSDSIPNKSLVVQKPASHRDKLGGVSGLSDEQRSITNDQFLLLPSYESVAADKPTFAEATKMIHNETNPYNARPLVQFHDQQAVVCNAPRFPISQQAMDAIYDLPYTRRPHPSYREPIPAFEMIKDSVTIMRGCFGGCTFCSITTHQGRIIQSRSHDSIIGEIQSMTRDPQFKGVISDIGGPTANMYEMRCSRPDVEAKCRRQSCV